MVRASSGPKLKRSYKDEEYKPGGGIYDGPAPTPGMHPVKLVSVEEHTSAEGNDGVKWTLDICEGKFTGWRGYVYTNDDTALWKEQEMLVALGVIKPNGSIDMTFDAIVKKAKPCRARIKNEMYDGEARGKIATLIPADAAGPATKGKGRADEPEDDAEFEDEAESDEELDERAEELAALSLVKLKAEAKKAGLTLADYKGKSDTEIIDLILGVEFPEDADEEDEEEPEDEDEEEGFDAEALQEELEKLTLVKLKARAKADYSATLADLKGLDKEEVIEWILDKAEEAAEGTDDEEEAEDEPEEEEEKPARGKASARSSRSRRGTTTEPPF